MDHPSRAILDAAIPRILHRAAAWITDHPVTDLVAQEKGTHDLVTATDRAVEAIIVAELQQAFPDHGIRGEEGTHERAQADLFWLVDPLDGTHNYVLDLPLVGVALGLFDQSTGEPQPVAGGIHLVSSGRTLRYHASSPPSCTLDAREVRPRTTGRACSLLTGYALAAAEPAAQAAFRADLALRGLRVLETWAPTTDWLSFCAGRIDAVILIASTGEETQVGLAAALSAGAVLHTPSGAPLRFLDGPVTGVVTSPSTSPEPLLQLLRTHWPHL